MDNIKGISVVVPNYNGEILLPKILPPLIVALENTKLPYEIIVADDCSTDESVNYLKQSFAFIKIITNNVNKGFAPTANLGASIAVYSHILFLNSDVILLPNYFDAILQKYFKDTDTFGVMGKIIGWDDDIVQDGGKMPFFVGKKIKTSGNFVPINPQKNNSYFSMYLSGANAFVDAEKFKFIGGFNEIFAPFYVEDFELSLRAWRLGYKCYYEHFSVCRHQTSKTIKSTNTKNEIQKIYYRNKMILHALHLDGAAYKIWYLQNFLEVIFQTLLGKAFYRKAYVLFRSLSVKIKKSKEDFNFLQQKVNSNYSTSDAINIIKSAIKDYTIKKF